MTAVDKLRELREDPKYCIQEFDSLLKRLKESNDNFYNTPLKMKKSNPDRIMLYDCRNYTENLLK